MLQILTRTLPFVRVKRAPHKFFHGLVPAADIVRMRTHQNYCDEYLPKLHFAANMIQKNFRGLLSRRNAKSIADAIAAEWARHRKMQALVIQCAFRCHVARVELGLRVELRTMRREERRGRLAELCRMEATRVQAWWRMRWERARYLVLRPRVIHAVTAVQANFHRRPLQQRYKEMQMATICLQGFARFMKSTRILRVLREKRDRWRRMRNQAVTTISACWRGYVCRQQFKALYALRKASAIRIQAEVRRMLAISLARARLTGESWA